MVTGFHHSVGLGGLPSLPAEAPNPSGLVPGARGHGSQPQSFCRGTAGAQFAEML